MVTNFLNHSGLKPEDRLETLVDDIKNLMEKEKEANGEISVKNEQKTATKDISNNFKKRALEVMKDERSKSIGSSSNTTSARTSFVNGQVTPVKSDKSTIVEFLI